MFLALLSNLVTVVLCLSNVFSTFKTLQQKDTPEAQRLELQFWSVYVLGVVLATMVSWLRGDTTPLLQLVLSVVLVLLKHLDTDHTVMSNVFRVAQQGMHSVDVHFVTPNSEKFLLHPCAQLVQFGLKTLCQSKSITDEDRQRATKALRRSADDLRAEIVKRDKKRFSAGGAVGDAAAPSPFPANPEEAPATPPANKARQAAGLSFAGLRRYFAQVGVLKTDEEISLVLKCYDGRDAELRRKLADKFHRDVDDVPEASTPRSAHTIGAASRAPDLAGSGPFTDNPLRRRKAAAAAGGL